MTAEKRKLTMLVHGSSKSGKSTFASTAPKPLLLIDAEGGWEYLHRAGYQGTERLKKITWHPAQAPPQYDGTWNVCRVTITQWAQMERVYQWLMTGRHGFRSIVVDSITEIQRRLKTNIADGDGVVQGYQGWGKLLAKMDTMIRGVRDLALDDATPVECALFVAETRHKDATNMWVPTMQGQIADQLPFWVSACGYMFQAKKADADGNATIPTSSLYIGKHPQYEAGNRFQGLLPELLENPNIDDMLTKLYEDTDNEEN